MNITFRFREDSLGYKKTQMPDGCIKSESVIVRTGVYSFYTSDGSLVEFTDTENLTRYMEATAAFEREQMEFEVAQFKAKEAANQPSAPAAQPEPGKDK